MRYSIWVYTYFNASAYLKGEIDQMRPTGQQAFTLEVAQRMLKAIQDEHHWCKRHREGTNWVSFRNISISHYQIIDNDVSPEKQLPIGCQ